MCSERFADADANVGSVAAWKASSRDGSAGAQHSFGRRAGGCGREFLVRASADPGFTVDLHWIRSLIFG
jgi:hypothetical protein